MSAPQAVRDVILLDVFGGDRGAASVLEGALLALPELSAELRFVGPAAAIGHLLKERRFAPLARRCPIVDAPEQIEMGDSIRALRSKPNSSIAVGARLAALGSQADERRAFVSAGHSGALMAGALLYMGRLAGLERPAIAVRLPTVTQEGCVLLDVGANVDCKPEHLRDFALMGACYAWAEQRRSHLPRVGLLANGEETTKGTELTRAAHALLQAHPAFTAETHPLSPPRAVARYIGYVEGKELFRGEVDVVVCDGFVGNVTLKCLEGLGGAVMHELKHAARSSLLSKLGLLLSAPATLKLKRKLDYAEYGAAPLLGVSGYAMVCHGRSGPRAIKNALLRTQSTLASHFVERLAQTLATDTTQASASNPLNHAQARATVNT